MGSVCSYIHFLARWTCDGIQQTSLLDDQMHVYQYSKPYSYNKAHFTQTISGKFVTTNCILRYKKYWKIANANLSNWSMTNEDVKYNIAWEHAGRS